MDEMRYAVGLDVGTDNVRAVILSVNKEGVRTVVGYAEAKNAGMRKGLVSNLSGPGEAIDRMLGEAERMSGYEVNSAHVSINGKHIISTPTEGMIAVGTVDHEIDEEDLARVEDVAVSGRIPANRDVLDVVPLEFAIDGQGGVKDPIGMTGSRLEMRATVISALTPNCDNLKKATESANVYAERLVPSVVASARAVLEEHQMENGVAVVDFGAATTSIAIFEEGDLQYVSVIPAGSNNVTNDLAIMLGIDTKTADDLKCKHVTGMIGSKEKPISMKVDNDMVEFERRQIDEVVQIRLKEIFEHVQKEIKAAHYEKRLPEGIVLTGGGTKMKDLDKFVKLELGCSVKVGVPRGIVGGVVDAVSKPEYAAAVGLALIATDNEEKVAAGRKGFKPKLKTKSNGKGFWAKIFGKK